MFSGNRKLPKFRSAALLTGVVSLFVFPTVTLAQELSTDPQGSSVIVNALRGVM